MDPADRESEQSRKQKMMKQILCQVQAGKDVLNELFRLCRSFERQRVWSFELARLQSEAAQELSNREALARARIVN